MAEPLEYLQPLFVGRMTWRSAKGIFFFAALSIFGTVWYATVGQATFPQPHGRLIAELAYLPFALVAVGMGVAIVMDVRQTTFVIEPGGVRIRRKLVPWEKVKRFGACVQSAMFWKHLQLFYCTKKYPAGFHLLQSDPLSVEEYERLIEALRDRIGHCEELHLGGYEACVSEGGGGSP